MKKNQPIQRREEPLLPAVMALLVIGIIGLTLFSLNTAPSTPTGAVVATAEEISCLRKAPDNSNIAVRSVSTCCFLMENTDYCRSETEPVYYRERSADFAGFIEPNWVCFGGSSERVYFTEMARLDCGFDLP